MIVDCPNCGQKFFLNAEKLPLPRTYGGKENGWRLSCGRCKHAWWQPFLPSSKPATSLDAFAPSAKEHKIPQREDYAHQNFKEPSIRQKDKDEVTPPSFFGENQDSSAHSEKNFSSLTGFSRFAEEAFPGNSRPKKAKISFSLIFLCLLFFVFIIAAGYTYRNELISLWRATFPASSIAPTQFLQRQPLILQNVRYDVQPTSGGEKLLVVIGEVVNNNLIPVPILPLHIIVRGACSSEIESSSTSASSSLCPKLEWDYQWDRPQLLPEERVSFQTTYILPKNSELSVVEVTLP